MNVGDSDNAPRRAERSGGASSRSSPPHRRPAPDAPPHQQVWVGMLAHLRRNYPEVCRQWFHELEPLGIDGLTLEMRCRTDIHRDYLRRQCTDQFNDAARTASGRLLSVRFLGPHDQATDFTTPAALPATLPATSRAGAPVPNGAAHPTHPTHPAVSTPAPTADQNPEVVVLPQPQPAPRVPAQPAASAPTSSGTPSAAAPHAPSTTHDAPPPFNSPPVPAGPPAIPPRTRSMVTIEDKPSPRGRYDTLVINPEYSFENFVVGPGNRLAHAAARAVADAPGGAYNPFFVHARVGLGKTHLLQAICLRIHQAAPNADIYYTSCESFSTQFFDSVQGGAMSDFHHRFRDVDVLIIDDIHFLTKRDQTQEEFFHTFNALFQLGKQIILSSDAAPEDIPDLEERLVSRFKWGLVATIEPPDYETRIQILKTKSRLRGMMMPDDVASFIAARIDSNIRELEGAISKLQLSADVDGEPLSLDMARSAFGVKPPEKNLGDPTIQDIIAVVTEFYNVRLSDLQSDKRPRSITEPRHVAMFLARKCTRLSLEEVGGFFGGRDHTTVMHSVKTVETRLEREPDFATLVKSLEVRVKGPSA